MNELKAKRNEMEEIWEVQVAELHQSIVGGLTPFNTLHLLLSLYSFLVTTRSEAGEEWSLEPEELDKKRLMAGF